MPTIEGTCSTAQLKEKVMGKLASLPPFSPVLNKLMASLADENVSFLELGDLIEKDTVLAGNVLRLVNSALYSRRGTINSVRRAVSILGLSKLRNAAMSMSVSRLWGSQKWPPGWSPSQFNLHAVATAIMADLLATELSTDYPEGAFAAGLLENVGMLLMAASLSEDFNRVRDHYLSNPAYSLVAAEREVLGMDHAELSAEVLGIWNLPKPIKMAAGEHHFPRSGSLGAIISAADGLVEQLGITAQSWHRPPAGTPEGTLQALGLGEPAPGILESFRAEYNGLKGFF